MASSERDALQPTPMSVQISHNTKRKRKWDRKNICVFCEKSYSKLPRHFEQKHNQEPDVAKFLSYKKNSVERKHIIKEITNKGNFAYNIKILEKGSGQIIPSKRPQKIQKLTVKEYSPCEYCLGFFVSVDLWKHQKKCPNKPLQKNSQNRNVKSRCSMLLPSTAVSSVALKKVLCHMNEDKVSDCIRNDQLILKYGEKILKVGKEQHNRHFISQKMRELGRLLIKVREIQNCSLTLADIIKPSQFLGNVSAVKSLAGYDEENECYSTPSLALKIGAALKKCAKIIKAEALMQQDSTLSHEADDFFQLCEMEWGDQVSSIALKTLREKKWNKPGMIPIVEDIVMLHKHLDGKASSLTKDLNNESPANIWYSLAKVVLTQIILFNRRRSGEASRINVENCLALTNDCNEDIAGSLSPLERKLCKYLHRFEVRGKRGNKVPVLLTKDMKYNVDCLIKFRGTANILASNKYLFAIPNSDNCVRGSDCLRIFAHECGAKYPNKITSTRLRKQVATLSQLFCLKENELDILANFMGHDIRVHRQYYRLSEDTLQMAKVSKILLAMEKGTIKSLSGKTLDEIDINVDGKYERVGVHGLNINECPI